MALLPMLAFGTENQAAKAAEDYSRGQASPSRASAAHGRAKAMNPKPRGGGRAYSFPSPPRGLETWMGRRPWVSLAANTAALPHGFAA